MPRKGQICGHLEKEALLIIVYEYLLGTFIFRLNNNNEYKFIICLFPTLKWFSNRLLFS